MNADFSTKLSQHLTRRLYNHHEWLQPMMEKIDVDRFPYQPAEKASKANFGTEVHPNKQPSAFPTTTGLNVDVPLYLLLIPHVPKEKNYIPDLLRKFKREAFDVCEKKPIFAYISTLQRLSVVIGINQMESLDSTDNEAFYNYVRNLKQTAGIAYRIFGRL